MMTTSSIGIIDRRVMVGCWIYHCVERRWLQGKTCNQSNICLHHAPP